MARMSRERWCRIATLLDEALELAAAERGRFLDAECSGDVELRAEVEALLAADADSNPLLDAGTGALAGLDTSALNNDVAAMRELRIGAYRIVRELGQGGMGVVYLAERADGQYEQQVALKLVRGGFASAQLVRRFLHERQILARLEHTHIARLLDGGVTADGLPFFVMEYVEGEPITSHCDRRQLSISARLRLFSAVCDAVTYAHRNLVIHRDLKPSNMLVTSDGKVKLLDFGIAKLLDDDAIPERATRTGAYPLTPEYAAPEQLHGAVITTATDVYALGAVLYELLCGRPAHDFDQRSPLALARTIGEQTPPCPSVAVRRANGAESKTAAALARARGMESARLQRLLHGDLDAIVMKALRKESMQRYPSVDALTADLERWRSGLPVVARRGTTVYRARKYVRRHRGVLAATALVVLSLTAGLAATTRQARVAQRESTRARAVTDFLIGLFRASDPAQARGRAPSALELLDSGVARVERELGNEPELQAEMLTVLGSIYRELAALPRADTLLRRAVALREQLHGAADERVVESLNQLGGLLLVTGEYAAADSALQRALAIRERVLGPHDTLVAVSLNNLAVARAHLGQDADAEHLYRRAVDIDRRVYGPAHLQVATDWSNLAGVLRRKGDYDGADSAIGAAVAIRRRLLPPDDPRLADALSQLATLRNAQGRGADAEQLYRDVLAVRRNAYGNAHPDVALALGGLASTLSNLGRLEEAAPLQREALTIQERVLGADHDETIASLNNLAVLRYRAGDLDAAANGMRDALTRWRRVLGEQHPRVLTAANNLGVVLTEQRAYGEAESLLRASLAGRRTALGEEHPEVASSLRNLGVLLHRTGRHAEAEQALQRALGIGRSVWTDAHPRLADVLLSYGELLVDRARPAEAEPMLREALAIRRERLGDDAAPVAEVQRVLTRALSGQGRTATAAQSSDRSLR